MRLSHPIHAHSPSVGPRDSTIHRALTQVTVQANESAKANTMFSIATERLFSSWPSCRRKQIHDLARSAWIHDMDASKVCSTML